MQYRLEIPGEPVSWARPRTKGKRFFDSQAFEKHKVQMFCLEKQLRPKIAQPIRVHFIFQFKKPRKTKIQHVHRKDVSNMIKFYEDALNDWLWADDRYIVSIFAEKRVGEEDKTIIHIGSTKDFSPME